MIVEERLLSKLNFARKRSTMNGDHQSEAWFAEQLAELHKRLRQLEQLESDQDRISGQQRVGFGPERTALLDVIAKLTNQLERMRSGKGSR